MTRRIVATRLPYTRARRAVDGLLRGYPHVRLMRDGEDGWSFVVCECEDNTTSYVHRDGTVEWYGTPWPNGDCDVCMEEA